jgi:hypothetical protein
MDHNVLVNLHNHNFVFEVLAILKDPFPSLTPSEHLEYRKYMTEDALIKGNQ